MADAAKKPTLRGVVFDMDGTLTVPNLDFAEMYRRAGVPRGQDILEAVKTMPAEQAAAANAVIDEMEAEGRRTLQLDSGAVHLARWLARHGVPMALVTRNTTVTVDHFQEKLWKPAGLPGFEKTISRDDPFPPKPDPGALRHISEHWGIPLGPELLMVGDSVANDIAFGKAAGVKTALLDAAGKHTADVADYVVRNLATLPLSLFKDFAIEGEMAGPLKKYPEPSPNTDATKAAVAGDVEALSACPGKVDDLDEWGNTPLIWAADAGQRGAVEYLLSKGADVNVRGFLENTAIARASRRGHLDILGLLLAVPGANCDTPNVKMQYPLHFAAFKGHKDAVRVLLDHSADTYVLDRKGRSPAEDTSDESIRQMILEAR